METCVSLLSVTVVYSSGSLVFFLLLLCIVLQWRAEVLKWIDCVVRGAVTWPGIQLMTLTDSRGTVAAQTLQTKCCGIVTGVGKKGHITFFINGCHTQ